MNIYTVQLLDCYERSLFQDFVDSLPFHRQKKIKMFRHNADALRCILGEKLIRYAIKKELGLNHNEIVIDTNIYGKPFLVNDGGFHFNISHSGKWVVCATGNQPVGIDVEMIVDIDIKIIENILTQQECDYLNKHENKLLCLYELWTLKESFLKMLGKGLSIDPKTINVIRYMTSPCQCFIKNIHIDDMHELAVCSMHDHSYSIINTEVGTFL